MKRNKSNTKQGRKQCLVCGNDVPKKGPWKTYCCIRCWSADNGEPPEPKPYDPHAPENFEGYKVGQ